MGDVEKLKEFIKSSKTEFKNMQVDEKLLRRYLVAHHTVDAAYERMVATDAWRKEANVAEITSETPGVKSSIALRVSKLLEERDNRRRPIVYVAVRNHSFRNRDVDAMTEYIIYMLEESCRKCLDDGPDNICILFDMKGFSLTCMDYPLVRVLFNIMTDHYPERLGVSLILNAPYIFSACWAIIRSWMDENTASKIKFIKGDEQLSSYVDPCVIPEDF
ncbi:uncharacterized protein LOC135207291 isoform X2 [Macrobrachium nipponense]